MALLKKPPKVEHHEPPHEEPPHSGGEGDDSNWIVSYADMMTLLCGFFIMLFSMAKMDSNQYDSFKEALAEKFGGQYISPAKELGKYTMKVLDELAVDKKKVIVKADANGVTVVFQSLLFFDTLSADIRPQGKKILEQVIQRLRDREIIQHKHHRIVIEGHTDGRPVFGGIYPSNWELSAARAARVVRLFLEKGFRPEDMTAIGYADTHPQHDARTQNGDWDADALAMNRRVVLRILEPSADSIPFPEQNTAHPSQGQSQGSGAQGAGTTPHSQPPASTPGSAPVVPPGAAPAESSSQSQAPVNSGATQTSAQNTTQGSPPDSSQAPRTQ